MRSCFEKTALRRPRPGDIWLYKSLRRAKLLPRSCEERLPTSYGHRWRQVTLTVLFWSSSSSPVFWSRFGRTGRAAREDFFPLWTRLGCFALGRFRWLPVGSIKRVQVRISLLFLVEPTWSVGGERKFVQHPQPDHRWESQQELQKLLFGPKDQVVDFDMYNLLLMYARQVQKYPPSDKRWEDPGSLWHW